MQVGTASLDITPDGLLALQGQMHLRMAERTRDPLTANAVAFSDGDTRVVLVSCDLCLLTDELVRSVQQACAEKTGIPASHVLLAATHTHVGPCILAFRETQVVDAGYLQQLQTALVEAVERAAADLEPVDLFADEGQVEQMGWNRRGLHDGIADMYWGSWRAGFAGIEGPTDRQVPVIWAKRADGSIKAVVTGFATHPNCCEGESFYSADLVGAVRRSLRQAFGERTGVVYLTGAAGNTAPSIMENNPHNVQPWRGEEGLERSGAYLGAEVIKTILGRSSPMPQPTLALAQETLTIPLRPWPGDFEPETRTPAGAMRDYYLDNRAQWDRILAEQSPTEVRLNVLRLGDAAICTNPAELYVEHGLAIKARSPARITMIGELTDGYCGYVPTQAAFRRGGYSTWTAPTSKLARDAGDQIVGATSVMLTRTFHGAVEQAATVRG